MHNIDVFKCIFIVYKCNLKGGCKNANKKQKRYKNKFQEGTRKKEYMVSKNTTRDCKNLDMPLQT